VNLLLLDPSEIQPDGTARLEGRRARHVREVLRAAPGGSVAAGVVGGAMGRAEVLACGDGELVLRPRLDEPPPPPSPVSLLLALPRPKILRKVLQGAASMGVKRIVLVGSWRVERSYFSSPLLEPEAMALGRPGVARRLFSLRAGQHRLLHEAHEVLRRSGQGHALQQGQVDPAGRVDHPRQAPALRPHLRCALRLRRFSAEHACRLPSASLHPPPRVQAPANPV